MNKPLISVITPAFNAGATIHTALRSVASQHYRPVEHLIMDGASTDDTVSIVEGYQEKYPHIRLYSSKDTGVYDAMNKGIDRCKGDWVYFLGADDELFSETVFSELFKENRFDREEVFYGNVRVVGDTSWATDGTLYDGPFDLRKLFRANICHQAIFYPREVIRETGYFNKKYFIAADWEYNIRCYARKEFVYVDKTIANFNGGGKSTAGGIDGIGAAIPKIVVRSFNLNPKDPSLMNPASPFSEIIKRYHTETVNKRVIDTIYRKLIQLLRRTK